MSQTNKMSSENEFRNDKAGNLMFKWPEKKMLPQKNVYTICKQTKTKFYLLPIVIIVIVAHLINPPNQ